MFLSTNVLVSVDVNFIMYFDPMQSLQPVLAGGC